MKMILSFLFVLAHSFLFSQKPEPPPPPPPASGSGTFQKIEVEPAFPGGEKGWTNYLLKNLNPTVPVTKGVRTGTYTVVIQFIVKKDGTIKHFKALTNHGFGMEEEAIRVIKTRPK